MAWDSGRSSLVDPSVLWVPFLPFHQHCPGVRVPRDPRLPLWNRIWHDRALLAFPEVLELREVRGVPVVRTLSVLRTASRASLSYLEIRKLLGVRGVQQDPEDLVDFGASSKTVRAPPWGQDILFAPEIPGVPEEMGRTVGRRISSEAVDHRNRGPDDPEIQDIRQHRLSH